MMKLKYRGVLFNLSQMLKNLFFFNAELKYIIDNFRFYSVSSWKHITFDLKLYFHSFLNTIFQNELNSYYVWTRKSVRCKFRQIHRETSQLVFFSMIHYFRDTIRLMNRISNSFDYTFVTNCHFFQITRSEYAL